MSIHKGQVNRAKQHISNALQFYVPNRLLQAVVNDGLALPIKAKQCFDCVVFFADVSGFTRLTESLSQQFERKEVGAEQLSFILSEYFDQLIQIILSHGGDVVKFAGDALLVFFTDDHAQDALKRAISCGARAQHQAQQIAQSLLTQYQGEPLALKISIGAGSISEILVGGYEDRYEYAVCGSAIDDAGRVADLTQPGETLISEKLFYTLEAADQELVQAAALTSDVISILNTPDWSISKPYQSLLLSDIHTKELAKFVPQTVVDRVMAGHIAQSILGDSRFVTVLFINLLDYGPDISDQSAQWMIETVQRIFSAMRGSINKLCCDEKGVSLIGGFGIPPLSNPDDPIRAVKAALNIEKSFQENNLRVAIGIANGKIYCGTVGTGLRQEYTVMGDSVNKAARLMQKSGSGILVDQQTQNYAHQEISFDQGDVLNLKGFSNTEKAYRPIKLLPKKSKTLIGRKTEKKLLESALAALNTTVQQQFIIIEGDAGLGKTMLLNHLLEVLKDYPDTHLFLASADDVNKPYSVWRDILLQYIGLTPESDLGSRDERVMDMASKGSMWHEFKDQLPLLNDILHCHLQESEYTKPIVNEVRSEKAHQLVVSLLNLKAKDKPLLIVLDDIHWLDSASWNLLTVLARNVLHCLIVVFSRPMGQQAPINYKQLLTLPHTKTAKLDRMSPEDITALVSRSIGADHLDDTLSQLIRKQTDGHPFFSEELARGLLDRDIIVIDSESSARLAPGVNISELQLPQTVERAIVSRIDRLDLKQQLTIKVASVIGRSFASMALRAIHPIDEDKSSLLEQLSILASLDLTPVEQQGRTPTYIFKHITTRNVAYDLLLHQQRKNLHKSIAHWYEQQYIRDAKKVQDIDYTMLAQHWVGAEKYDKAVEYFDKGARQAEEAYANNEVIKLIEYIKECIEKGKLVVDKLNQARWDSMMGKAYLALGKFDLAQQCYTACLEHLGRQVPQSTGQFIVKVIKEISRQCLHRYVPGLIHDVKDEEKVQQLQIGSEAIERLFIIYFLAEHTLGLLYTTFAAVNVAERIYKPTGTLARSFANISAALGSVPLVKVADYYEKRALEVATQVEDDAVWAWVCLVVGSYQAGRGRWQEMEYNFHKVMELGVKIGDQRRFEEAGASLAIASVLNGRFSDLVKDGTMLGQKVYESAHSRGVYQSQGWGLCVWTYPLLCQGKIELAAENAKKILEIFSDNADVFDAVNKLEVYTISALVALRLNETEQAKAWIQKGIELVKEFQRPTQHRNIPCTYFLAEAAFLVWSMQSDRKQQPFYGWVKTAMHELKRCTEVFPTAIPRSLMIQGRFAFMMGKQPQAIKLWTKGYLKAQELDMQFDMAIQGLALLRVSKPLPGPVHGISEQDINHYFQQMDFVDTDYYEKWFERRWN